VIGMDGGRVQTREKSEETGSRWKEDKVLDESPAASRGMARKNRR